MSHMRISFRIEAHKGCLVLSGVDSWGDVSEWDPNREQWFRDEDSFIFPVASVVDGKVEIEVWNGRPDLLLPEEFFSRQEVVDVEEMEVFDPGGQANVRFRVFQRSLVSLFANSRKSPNKVQIFVENGP